MRHRLANATRSAALALLALPAAAAAHAGHDHVGLLGGALHHVLLPAAVAAAAGLAVAGARRLSRARASERRDG